MHGMDLAKLARPQYAVAVYTGISHRIAVATGTMQGLLGRRGGGLTTQLRSAHQQRACARACTALRPHQRSSPAWRSRLGPVFAPAPTQQRPETVCRAREDAQAPQDELPDADDFDDELLEDEMGEEDWQGEDEADEFELGDTTPEEIAAQLGYEDDSAQEAARQERLRMAQEAASSGGSGPSRYPEPEERGYFLSELFDKAAFFDAAAIMEHDFPDTLVHGLQSNPDKIVSGDMYICVPNLPDDDVPDLVQRAIANQASALLIPSLFEGMEGLDIPATMPCHYVLNVPEVADRLAVAFYDAPSRDLLTVGVVGGSGRGKTTVSWLVCGILEAMEQLTGTINDCGYSLSGDLMDVDGELFVPPDDDIADRVESSAPFRITPYHPGRYQVQPPSLPALQMHKLLAGMRDRGATCAVVEVATPQLRAGSHQLLELAVAVHTDLSNEDVEDPEELREAQLQVFDALIDPNAQAAVVNLDDLHAPMVLHRTGAMPTVTYSYSDSRADVRVESAKYTIWESEVIINTPEGKLQIITPLLGKHNMCSVLAAVATGVALKIPLAQIVAGIEAVEVVPGRCEIVDEGQPFPVIIDNTDTPDKLEEVLTQLRKECGAKRIWTVFGCRGEEDRALRGQMMEVADELSDFVIVTNDSPRREAPEQIVSDIVSGLPDDLVNKYSGYVYKPFQDQSHVPLWFEAYLQKAQRLAKRYMMEDRYSAIRCAIGTARADDVVLIAGRGSNDVMEYWDGEEGVVRAWFDDRVEARNALQKLSILAQLDGKLDRSTLPWTTDEDGKGDGLDWDDDDDVSDDDDDM